MDKKRHYKRGSCSNIKPNEIIRENEMWESYYKQLNLLDGNKDECEPNLNNIVKRIYHLYLE